MKITFSFGRNWMNYVQRVVDEQVVEEAVASLKKYGVDFKGKVFVDVGCGSGLFSLAALRLGAQKVISFDVDEYSIKATEFLRKKFSTSSAAAWEVFQGSILDEKLVVRLTGKGDIVYSWGVLHHTGNMWKAIELASKIVADNGAFIIAIYNHAPSSEFWWRVKRFYNAHPWLQPLMILAFSSYFLLAHMIRHRTVNLWRERGMHVFYDVVDWIGGFPYEYACFDEVKNFVESLGFELTKAPTRLPCGKDMKVGLLGKLRTAYTGCNEFVFRKK